MEFLCNITKFSQMCDTLRDNNKRYKSCNHYAILIPHGETIFREKGRFRDE